MFAELDPDRLDDEVRLNVGALTRLSHAALAVMVPRGRGYLLNVSSVASFQPAPRLAVYAATKAYVTSLTESLHEEVARRRREGDCAVPRPHPHRVPERQQHRELPVDVSGVRVARRRPTSPGTGWRTSRGGRRCRCRGRSTRASSPHRRDAAQPPARALLDGAARLTAGRGKSSRRSAARRR